MTIDISNPNFDPHESWIEFRKHCATLPEPVTDGITIHSIQSWIEKFRGRRLDNLEIEDQLLKTWTLAGYLTIENSSYQVEKTKRAATNIRYEN